jgi:hypothetical protein
MSDDSENAKSGAFANLLLAACTLAGVHLSPDASQAIATVGIMGASLLPSVVNLFKRR